MFNKIYPQMWMELPHDIRIQLAQDFELTKSKGTEVIGNVVVTDGHTVNDLSKINQESMKAYVGSTADFPRLWEITVAKARSIINPPMGEITSPKVVDTMGGDITDKVTKKSNAKKSKSN